MTIRAAYPAGVHSRLQEGTVDIDLVTDLPIGVIEAITQKGEPIGVVEWRAGKWADGAQRLAPGMTASALLNFRFGIRSLESNRHNALS